MSRQYQLIVLMINYFTHEHDYLLAEQARLHYEYNPSVGCRVDKFTHWYARILVSDYRDECRELNKILGVLRALA